MLSVRRYQDRDHAEVVRLHHLGLDQFDSNAGPGPWDDDFDDIPGHYFGKGEFLVGTREGRVVAMGAFRRVSDETAEIKRMRVRLDLQRRGLGERILETLEARATELGYTRLVLDTTATQVHAQSFYAKHGYREIRRDTSRSPVIIYFEKNIPWASTSAL